MIDEDKIDHHPSHPGYTLKQEKIERLYTCDGCKELGFGTCYTCTNSTACNFHLHKDCAYPEEIISHPFYPNLQFHFLKEGSPNRYCDACGKDINGYVYHCYEEGFDLHPCCAKLPHVLENIVTDEGDELKLVLKKKASSKCNKCGKKELSKEVKNTWSYASENKNAHFHVFCVNPNRVCDACLKDINGFDYHSHESSCSDLHPCCARVVLPHVVKDMVTDEGEEVKFVHKEEEENTSKCLYCRERKRPRSWSYVSEDEKVHFHVSCLKDMALESLKNGMQIDIIRDACSKPKVKHHQKNKKKLLKVKHHHHEAQKKRRESWNYKFWSKFGRLKKMLKMAAFFGMAAVLGCDPTAAFVLAASFSSTSRFNNGVKSGEPIGISLGVNFGGVSLGVDL